MRWEYNEAEELRSNNISEASLLIEFDPDWPLQAISSEWVIAVGYCLLQHGKTLQFIPKRSHHSEKGKS